MPLTERVAFLLGKLGRLAADSYTERLAPLGLRPPAAVLLSVVAESRGASQEELGRILQQAPSGIVALLDDLEGLGAVRRSRDRSDRRRHVIVLTKAGTRLLDQAESRAHAVDEDLLSVLDADDRRLLTKLLYETAQRSGVVPSSATVVDTVTTPLSRRRSIALSDR